MNSNSLSRYCVIITTAILLSTPVLAQQNTGYYIGASVGQSKTSIDAAPYAAIGAVVTKSDDSNSAFRIFGGYQLTNYLGIEASYVDLGAFGASGTIGAAGFSATGDVNGVSLTGIGTLPLGQKVSLLGNAGVFFSKVKATASVGTIPGSAKDDDTDITAGIGLKYDLSKNVAARLDATYYGLGDNGNAKLYSLGLQYKF
ncbi:MAG: outer membrane beta-barrel protein [Betaproteobacteria bacterium]|nr:outer membrane beta-barrel protein [Betaproteobacteria bacterium]